MASLKRFQRMSIHWSGSLLMDTLKQGLKSLVIPFIAVIGIQEIKMTFDVYTKSNMHFIIWFDTVDQLLASMKRNPNDAYHRRMK